MFSAVAFVEAGEVVGLLEGPDKLVGVLVQLDLDFVGKLPFSVAPADRLFPRSAVGRWIHKQHSREHRQVLARPVGAERSVASRLPP
ncbi:hypothetical protein [Myxococcus hansupus]|uniref:hypothetical protein n=1 Tax=Pseudomyxococcus hansupus TaxID=1297742 RepID=UPI00187375CE|nr:hypothetical protein [Myxococcus hansupus]